MGLNARNLSSGLANSIGVDQTVQPYINLDHETIKDIAEKTNMTAIGTASADYVEYCGIRPRMYIEDIL